MVNFTKMTPQNMPDTLVCPNCFNRFTISEGCLLCAHCNYHITKNIHGYLTFVDKGVYGHGKGDQIKEFWP
jgi:hypothetical protein